MKVCMMMLMFCCWTAWGQPGPAGISLADCIAKAAGNNPSLKISRARTEAAQERLSEMTAALLPQIKLTGGASELSSVPDYSLTLPAPINMSKVIFPDITENYTMKLSLQQPLYMGSKLSSTKEAAGWNAQAAEQD